VSRTVGSGSTYWMYSICRPLPRLIRMMERTTKARLSGLAFYFRLSARSTKLHMSIIIAAPLLLAAYLPPMWATKSRTSVSRTVGSGSTYWMYSICRPLPRLIICATTSHSPRHRSPRLCRPHCLHNGSILMPSLWSPLPRLIRMMERTTKAM
jgi:hypothetical protein